MKKPQKKSEKLVRIPGVLKDEDLPDVIGGTDALPKSGKATVVAWPSY